MLPAMPSPSSEHPRARVRVAVLVDGSSVPAAVARRIEQVAKAPVDLFAILVVPRDRPPAFASRLEALADRADRLMFRPTPDAFRSVDLRQRLGDLIRAGRPSAVRGAPEDFDIVLDLTTTTRGAPSTLDPRLGTWSLRHGDCGRPLDRSALSSTFTRGLGVAAADLVAVGGATVPATGGSPESRVLSRSVGAMARRSPARSQDAAAWKASEFPARVLTFMADGVGDEPDDEARPSQPAWDVGAGDVLRLIAVALDRSPLEAVRRVYSRPSWFVATQARNEATTVTWPPNLTRIRPIAAPAGPFFADPFLGSDGRAVHPFVEDAPVGGGPGRISTLSLDQAGNIESGPSVVLERSTHLSYLLVVAEGDDWYLLPETGAAGTVELFRARRFPGEWEPGAVLLRDVRAAHPRIVRHSGRYWMSATVGTVGADPCDGLCVYWADALAGPRRPHRGNPVLSDARRARPAGRILADGDSLIRPAPVCSGGCGGRVVLNRIDVLSDDEYRETPIGAIEPRALAGALRTHMYAARGRFEAVDALWHAPRWRWRPSATAAAGERTVGASRSVSR